jgi:hypothetical protein
MLSVVMLCVFMLSDGRNAPLSIADCLSTELHFAECGFAQWHYTACILY